MTIKQALIKYKKVEIDLLLSVVLKKSREFLYMNPGFILTTKHTNILTRLVKRREKGEPSAYILGYKDFYGMRFMVNRNVLIPRPETEQLVDLALSKLRSFDPSPPSPCQGREKTGRPETEWIVERLNDFHSISNEAKRSEKSVKSKNNRSLDFARDGIKILDIGTGSGCMAVSIAKQLHKIKNQKSKIKIYASDISKKALAVAKQNAKVHKVRIKFVKSDLLKNIRFVPDIVIANLPYGWNEWRNNTLAETIGLKFEPKEALFTKEKGLYEIHRLLNQVTTLPYLPKIIFLEFDPRQKVLLDKLIKKTLPSTTVKFYKDFSQKWRFAEINPK